MPRRPTPDDLRRRLLAAARQLAGAEDVAVVLVRGQVAEVIAEPPARPVARRPPPPVLSPVQRVILEHLTAAPVTSRQLARLCGRRWNAYFREQLRRLVTAGLCRHTSDGYALP